MLSGGSRQSSSSRLKANGGQEATTRGMCLQGSRLPPSRAHASVRLTLKTSAEMKQRLQDSYTNNQTSGKTKPKRKADESAELWSRQFFPNEINYFAILVTMSSRACLSSPAEPALREGPGPTAGTRPSSRAVPEQRQSHPSRPSCRHP